MGNDWGDGWSSNNRSITRFTNDALLQASTSTAMTSLLTLSTFDGEFVTVVTASVTVSSATDRLGMSNFETGFGSEIASTLAEDKGEECKENGYYKQTNKHTNKNQLDVYLMHNDKTFPRSEVGRWIPHFDKYRREASNFVSSADGIPAAATATYVASEDRGTARVMQGMWTARLGWLNEPDCIGATDSANYCEGMYAYLQYRFIAVWPQWNSKLASF